MRSRTSAFVLVLLLVLATSWQSANAQNTPAPSVCGVQDVPAGTELTTQVAEGLLVKPTEEAEIEILLGPSTRSDVVGTVTHDIMEVIGGPTTLNRLTWWQVRTSDGTEGWVYQIDSLAVGTQLTDKVVAFSDGWCAAHPEEVAVVRFTPRGYSITPAWGLYFTLPVEISEGLLYFLNNPVPTDDDEVVNITEEDSDTVLVRIKADWFLEFRVDAIDLRTTQFWFLWEDGQG
jgi:hypothetical protein